MKKAALTGLAALGLVEISAGTPAVAQGANPFAGVYAGAHAGRYSGDANFASAPYSVSTPACCAPGTAPSRNDFFSINGSLVGAHGGFNVPLGNNLVAGLEVDWTDLGDADSVSVPTTVIGTDGLSFQHRSELEFEWQSTVRGRLGFVAGNTLFFTTAGVAFLEVNWSETASKTFNGGPVVTLNHSKSETLVGVAAGAGVEVAVTPSVIFGADYLYENFESFNSVPHGAESGLTGTLDDIDVQKLRVRVSFKFGGTPR